ncbi:Mad3/BUB1 homology region 1-domain-containing protein [Linnemannia elongata]|nr:Mad3/BUB1 homology region 1-domain-containing protein [Linnemannia elongata]
MQEQHTHNGLRRDSFSPPPASETSFSSVVVDIDAIELEKENIQPLRQGRSAQTLARLFTTQHDDRAQQQAVMHGRFQAELAHIDDLDDPMDVYSRYVKWMIENYPQSAGQGHDSQLSPVLERALTDFKDDERYRNDPRFVKLLIIYSEKISNTIELFNYMEANGIGSEIAMYYEEFADFLESREEFDRAREVFVTGINRRARPLGRLKKQYEDFERRAQVYKDELELEAVASARSTSVPPQQHHQQDHSATSSSSGGSQRRVLGVKVSGTQSIHSNASTQGHVSIGQERSTSSTTTSRARSTESCGPSRPNAKLQVYTDQPSQPSVPTKPKATSKNSTSQASTPWRDFGAEQVRRKENTREVTSWKGATLSSEDTVPRRLLPKLEVYRDPEDIQLRPRPGPVLSVTKTNHLHPWRQCRPNIYPS